MSLYSVRYAERYVAETIGSSYTRYKNQSIALAARELNIPKVWDMGSNVNGMVKRPGSLRYELELVGIEYTPLDLYHGYFSQTKLSGLGLADGESYPSTEGVVGDLRVLPYAPDTLDGVVSADVIEHIAEPTEAIGEIARVLSPGARALLVIPSLYKLDAVRFDHISSKRYSTHENRLALSEWTGLITDSGLTVDLDNSRPLGFSSGLLYLSWLVDDYVPARGSYAEREDYSDRAEIFRLAKAEITDIDPELDPLVGANEIDGVMDLLREGRVGGAMSVVGYLLSMKPYLPEKPAYRDLCASFDDGEVDESRLLHFVKEMESVRSECGKLTCWGNSVLLVVEKPLYQ